MDLKEWEGGGELGGVEGVEGVEKVEGVSIAWKRINEKKKWK